MIEVNFVEGEPCGIAKFYRINNQESTNWSLKSEDEINPEDSYLKLVCKAVVSKSFKIELVLMAFFHGRTVFMNTKINPFSKSQKLIINHPDLIQHNLAISNSQESVGTELSNQTNPQGTKYFGMMYDYH